MSNHASKQHHAAHPAATVGASQTVAASAPAAPGDGMSARTMAEYGGGAVATLVILFILWRARKWLWAKRDLIADYVVALGTVLTVYHFALGGRMGYITTTLCVGWGLLLSAGLRTVRLSGLVPRKRIVELLWVVPATPFVLLWAVVRNMRGSSHYTGLIAFFVQLAVIAYFTIHPNWFVWLALLSFGGFFGGGLVRVYAGTFEELKERGFIPVKAAIAAQVAWPFYAILGLIVYLFQAVCGSFSLAIYLIPVTLVVTFIAAAVDCSWYTQLGICVELLSLVPAAGGLLMMMFLPTG